MEGGSWTEKPCPRSGLVAGTRRIMATLADQIHCRSTFRQPTGLNWATMNQNNNQWLTIPDHRGSLSPSDWEETILCHSLYLLLLIEPERWWKACNLLCYWAHLSHWPWKCQVPSKMGARKWHFDTCRHIYEHPRILGYFSKCSCTCPMELNTAYINRLIPPH